MSTTSTSTQTTPKLSPNCTSIRYRNDLSNYLKPRSGSGSLTSSNINLNNNSGFNSNITFNNSPNNNSNANRSESSNPKATNLDQSRNEDSQMNQSPILTRDLSSLKRKGSLSISPKTRSPNDIDPFLKQYLKTSNSKSNYFLNNLNEKKDLEKYKKNIILIKPRKSLSFSKKSSSPVQHKDQTTTKKYDSHYNLIKRTSSPKIHTVKKIRNMQDDSFKFLPKDFVNCSLDDLIMLVSRMLTNLIELNDKMVPKDQINQEGDKSGKDKKTSLTRYHSRTPPNISPINYLTRLSKFNNFSNATLLTTIYYIDLLSFNYQPFFTLNSWTVHRFLLIATMTCQKSMEDFFFTNDHYAKVGGVNLNELNCLELDFLNRIDWKCVPTKNIDGKHSIKYSKNVLDLYYLQLVELVGKNPSISNVVYSFTEGDDNLQNDNRQQMMKDVNNEIDLDDDEMDSDFDSDDELGDLEVIDKTKYNKKGFSVDGSSSPHLKRRYENL
ncbi:putative nuc-1 negative regulatory protein Pregp [[Candida] jaroonii]|uniref:Nuc-1 negative regulatory protein Pregp n=1 Tax=[Candida] jaroonii TaxID=467808 RepID=A0ACA9YCK2_9ASCO|nr:putative nuc-1 negative regulatory protein Pregp [[Candida] jaroonii]